MKCGYCGWEWKPRVEYPVECPNCHRRIRENADRRIKQLVKPIEIRPPIEVRAINKQISQHTATKRLKQIKKKAKKGGL